MPADITLGGGVRLVGAMRKQVVLFMVGLGITQARLRDRSAQKQWTDQVGVEGAKVHLPRS